MFNKIKLLSINNLFDNRWSRFNGTLVLLFIKNVIFHC